MFAGRPGRGRQPKPPPDPHARIVELVTLACESGGSAPDPELLRALKREVRADAVALRRAHDTLMDRCLRHRECGPRLHAVVIVDELFRRSRDFRDAHMERLDAFLRQRQRRTRCFGRRSRGGDPGARRGRRPPRLPRVSRPPGMERTLRRALPEAGRGAPVRRRRPRPRRALFHRGERCEGGGKTRRRGSRSASRAVATVRTRATAAAAQGRGGVRGGHRGVPRDPPGRQAVVEFRERRRTRPGRGRRRRRRRRTRDGKMSTRTNPNPTSRGVGAIPGRRRRRFGSSGKTRRGTAHSWREMFASPSPTITASSSRASRVVQSRDGPRPSRPRRSPRARRRDRPRPGPLDVLSLGRWCGGGERVELGVEGGGGNALAVEEALRAAVDRCVALGVVSPGEAGGGGDDDGAETVAATGANGGRVAGNGARPAPETTDPAGGGALTISLATPPLPTETSTPGRGGRERRGGSDVDALIERARRRRARREGLARRNAAAGAGTRDGGRGTGVGEPGESRAGAGVTRRGGRGGGATRTPRRRTSRSGCSRRR